MSWERGSVQLSPEIRSRDEFPLLAAWRRIETVVEIGVDRGVFAEQFMSQSPRLRHYIGVDPYLSTAEFPSSRDGDLAVAATRFSKFPCGALVRMSSGQLAESIAERAYGHIKEGVVGMVYIDAEHDYRSVMLDIAVWWDLVSDNGIIAGHDYDPTHPGVMEAVQEFARKVDRCVLVTDEPCASWYCYKNQDQSFGRRWG